MNAYLWTDIEKVSANYHEGGSVLIEAETLERARELAVIELHRYNYETREHEVIETIPMVGVEKNPDGIFESTTGEEKVWVFADAGCC